MLVIDTNLLVRFAVADDLGQYNQVVDLLEDNRVRILFTVLLETEWVLRSRYSYKPKDFISLVNFLLSQEHIIFDNSQQVCDAIRYHDGGMDFADALHCAQTEVRFCTFDRKLSKKAESFNLDIRLL